MSQEYFASIMDKLQADQQEQLKKCSTARLRVKLAQAGIVEENILGMDRSNLSEAMANVKPKGSMSMRVGMRVLWRYVCVSWLSRS